ncbi:MAG: c-type cytochrome [Gammaproteobacteria bacterium]|nr:c-type cytochrome [Gammaproteobacteria bacterium]
MKLRDTKRILISTVAALLGMGSLLVCSVTLAAESDVYSIARGGRLYDKWFKESPTAKTPEIAHPGYPDSGKYKGNKGTDWRCKECHGWDYRGNEGAYAEGKHYTGIKGIGGMTGADPTSVVAVLKNQTHAMTASGLSEQDYHDLAMFVSKGQTRSDGFIDDKSKKVTGDTNAGQGYFETVCARCHGLDGKEDDQIPPLGKLANDNPWEVLHKIINGQPDEEMPALLAFGNQVAVDILAYLQTLPQE